MKRILTVQDISCVGKCSLTVALPIISAFGVETAVLPTAVLSTHTAFKHFTFRDLTEDIPAIEEAWRAEVLGFDAIYTGYLGSEKQIAFVEKLFDDFRDFGGKRAFTLVDPVMADNGKLYCGFNEAFAAKMTVLCKKADVIVPNLTEATLMLGEPYVAEGYDENYIKALLKKLTNLGAKTAIVTGVSFEKEKLGAYGYDSRRNEYFYCYGEKLPVSYHGTGDIFASAICGATVIGKSIKESTQIAVDFTVESIKLTMRDIHANFYGVNFEEAIPYLIERIKK